MFAHILAVKKGSAAGSTAAAAAATGKGDEAADSSSDSNESDELDEAPPAFGADVPSMRRCRRVDRQSRACLRHRRDRAHR